MPVVKGGVWTNIEDEILKASVSKYGLNQWARVSSLLARKTPKQCKARWTEWLDPAIRKIEWSKEEDEKLLHLAKLMPTQWRTIAPIVGRTATQCLERYQKLLDEAEARENDELALGGPDGAETAAPTGDDVRKLRPGELDPDPESKPAKPDTIDLDEDEKEMLSEARARLANTQGKKAKRKARERQLEESRRLAVLQKRRELKNAGINLKITHKKKGQMDYNADVPFEHAPAAGFYDTLEEKEQNEKEKEAFDPRKQQLERKRRGDPEDQQDSKRQKHDKGQDEAKKAAARAAQLQRMREAEQQSKRRPLNLPAPQVSDAELEDIVKVGIAGDRAAKSAGDEGLASRYTNLVGETPVRTPRAPATEDLISNELRNIRALNNTQSSLLGGENTPLHTGSGTTGFEGTTPRRQNLVTPNPMATPFRQSQPGPGATPLRTPRDNFALNAQGDSLKTTLRAKLASLPKPKATEFELELPEEDRQEVSQQQTQVEDQEDIDNRAEAARKAAAAAEFTRQTRVIQQNLPRPQIVDYASLQRTAKSLSDPIESLLAQETALLMAHDASTKPLSSTSTKVKSQLLPQIEDKYLALARKELEAESLASASAPLHAGLNSYFAELDKEYPANDLPVALARTTNSGSLYKSHSAAVQSLMTVAESNNKREKKLALILNGYAARQKGLLKKIKETHEAVMAEGEKLNAYESLSVAEEVGLRDRLDRARETVGQVVRREREVGEEYRQIRDELRDLQATQQNLAPEYKPHPNQNLMNCFEPLADAVKRKRGRPKVDPSLDTWIGVQDSKERKRIQDRLAQRTRRGRLLSKDPSCNQVIKKNSNEDNPVVKTTPMTKRSSKKTSSRCFDPECQLSPAQHTKNPKQCVRVCLALSSFDYPSGNVNGLFICNDHKFLRWDAWPFYSALVTHGLMQGTGCPEADQDSTCPLHYLSLPDSLKPTPLQFAMPHKRWIDRMPFPRLRDNIILLNSLIDLDDFIQDLLGNAGVLMRTDSPRATWDAEAWIFSPEFSIKWGYLFM